MRNLILLITVVASLQVFSQQKIKFKSSIKEQIVNSYTETLLVKTRTDLCAIDTKTHKMLWCNNDLRKVNFSEYSEIPYTSIILFEQKPLVNSKIVSNILNGKGKSKILLNILTGEVLFDSKKQGFSAVNNCLILPQKKRILVDGIKNKEFVISLHSCETGMTLWQIKKDNRNFLKTIDDTFFDDEKIILDIQQNIYWLKNKQLIKIDGETGVVLLKKENVTSIEMNPSKDVLFVFSNKISSKKLDEENIITAINTETQENLWKEPTRILGNISTTVFDNDKIVIITSKGFNVIDLKTGQKQWNRSESLPLIKKVVPVDSGYLVVQDKFLIKIDNQGKKAWDKKIKIMYSAQENPIYIIDNKQQALFITPSQANKVEIYNGAKMWKENLILNTQGFFNRNLNLNEHYFKVWYDAPNKLFPLYTDNKFYILDLKSSKEPTLIGDLDFDKKTPNLKIIENGYLLYEDNKFYLYNRFGKLIYKKEYPYFSNSDFLSEALNFAERSIDIYSSATGLIDNQVTGTLNSILVSKDFGPLSNISSNVYGSYLSYENSLNKLTTLNNLDVDFNVSTILHQIKASKKNNENLLIVIPKGKNESEIIRLNINSGNDKVIKTIKNDYSNFLIDQVEGKIYFFRKKDILIEKMNE